MVLCLPDSWSNWNLEMLVFEERGKLEYLEKNLSEERREPTTNSTHIWRRRRDLKPGHIGGRQVLSPLRHPLLPWFDVSLCLQYYCVSTSAQSVNVGSDSFCTFAPYLRITKKSGSQQLILFLPLEHKIHIFSPPCNILYECLPFNLHLRPN